MRDSSDLDARRRRILYRAWHCGTLESDLLLGRFLDVHISGLTDSDLSAIENFMDLEVDVLGCVTGCVSYSSEFESLITRLRNFWDSASH